LQLASYVYCDSFAITSSVVRRPQTEGSATVRLCGCDRGGVPEHPTMMAIVTRTFIVHLNAGS
jgi:hypothetical protein